MLKLFQKVKQAGTVINVHPLHGLSVKLDNRVLQPVPEKPTRLGQNDQSGSALQLLRLNAG